MLQYYTYCGNEYKNFILTLSVDKLFLQYTRNGLPVWCWQIMLGNTNNKMLNYAAAPDLL